jgi:phenylalanyl-tRNA synthetase beta chain
MIVTKSWLSKFIDISDIDVDKICKVFNSIGLEVDSVTNYKVPAKIVIGHVVECEKHPNADKLNVCKVDVGTAIRQIVCGAKNVAKGQYVPVAILGAKLPNGLEIKPVKLRDVESDGMICSSSELGLPKVNDGILELDNSIGELTVGKELREYEVFNDTVIEIELTANRGDCLSIYGVARELSTALEIPLKNIESFEEDDNLLGIGRVLHVSYEQDVNASTLYKAIELNESSFPLAILLQLAHIEKNDQTDIEKIIDYIIHTTGVVIRGYNVDNIAKSDNIASIGVKKDELGLDVVVSKDKKISTIGIFDEEKELKSGLLVFEASYINPDRVSIAVADNKLKTDELYYRTSRGSEPNLEFGINYLLNTLSTFFDVNIYAGVSENIHNIEEKSINVNIDKVCSIIGQKVTSNKIVSILTSLGFKANATVQDNYLVVKVPGFRHDINNIQDIVEEITRIIGIDNIQSKPLEYIERNTHNQEYITYINKRNIRYKSIGEGFNETITFVFGDKEKLKKYGYKTINDDIDLANPITNELNTLRNTILLNLLDGASLNIKNGYKSVSLFEIGSVFDENREESTKVAFLFSGNKDKANILNSGKPTNMDFFTFADKVSSVIGEFELEPIENPSVSLIHPYQSANIIIAGEKVGEISKLHINVAKDYELPDTFIAEVDFDKISFTSKKAKEVSKYQLSNRDLSFVVPKSIMFKDIKDAINSNKPEELVKFYPLDIYESEELGDNISLTIRLELQSYEKTLEEADITSAVDKVLESLKTNLKLELR